VLVWKSVSTCIFFGNNNYEYHWNNFNKIALRNQVDGVCLRLCPFPALILKSVKKFRPQITCNTHDLHVVLNKLLIPDFLCNPWRRCLERRTRAYDAVVWTNWDSVMISDVAPPHYICRRRRHATRSVGGPELRRCWRLLLPLPLLRNCA
jgi:hypothetical protein